MNASGEQTLEDLPQIGQRVNVLIISSYNHPSLPKQFEGTVIGQEDLTHYFQLRLDTLPQNIILALHKGRENWFLDGYSALVTVLS